MWKALLRQLPLLLVLMCSIWILASAPSNPDLFTDTDTIGILNGIKERHNAISWFVTDWPLQNHFYRPISTLAFEFDQWRHPGNARGFGLTNAFLIAAAIPLLFLLGNILFKDLWKASAASILFTCWSLEYKIPYFAQALFLIPVALFLATTATSLRSGKPIPWKLGLGVLAMFLLSSEANGVTSLEYRTLMWLPGRTATTMSVFALATVILALLGIQKSCWRYGIGALLCFALALGSYEQAVMLPFIVICLAAWLPKFESKRSVVFGSLCMLGLYMWVRLQCLPTSTSRYQSQQLRNGIGFIFPLSDYSLPLVRPYYSFVATLDSLPLSMLVPSFYELPIALVCVAATWRLLLISGRWRQGLGLMLAGFFAILPMAFLQHFDHYHYFPMMFRALWVVFIASTVWEHFQSTMSWRWNSFAAPATKTSEPA